MYLWFPRDLLGLADFNESLQDLLVAESRVSQDGAARLDGLDDFGGVVARQGEAGGARVQFHGSAQRLLRAGGHAAVASGHESES